MKAIGTTGIIAAVVIFMCSLVFVGYLLADTDESAGPEEGVTLNDVLEDPARYEGEQVTVSGEWAENEFRPADQAEEAMVLGDDAGATLLVVPQLGVDVPDVDENTVLRVTGEVRVPERGDAGYVDRGGLLTDDGEGPEPVIAAERVELTLGESDDVPSDPDEATVEQLLHDPRAFDEAALIVPGTASRVGDRGFVLSDDGATIFVSAPASELERLENGERVTIRAELSRLSSLGSDALEKAIASDPPGDQPRSELDLDDVPVEPGEPYLLFRAFPAR